MEGYTGDGSSCNGEQFKYFNRDYICIYVIIIQILMSVQVKRGFHVISMQTATIQLVVSCAPVLLDILEMACTVKVMHKRCSFLLRDVVLF